MQHSKASRVLGVSQPKNAHLCKDSVKGRREDVGPELEKA